MEQCYIYSIGHGNKKIDEFIEELLSHNIEYLIDIRSKPYSKWNPQFNQNSLEADLKNHNIKYGFMGEQLGGLPSDRSCYNAEGKVLYEELKKLSSFRKGLKRLYTANEKRLKVAIMCSEAKPEECHRSKVIGHELLLHFNLSVNHIISSKLIKSQEEVISEVTRGLNTINLFGDETDFISRKSH